jgi:Recombination endonuclease VII
LCWKIPGRSRLSTCAPLTPSLWHTTCNHRQYNVSCEQFDGMLVTARFACQRCGQASERLVIDHDHALGWWAVRGLLCSWCNSHLGQVDGGRKPCDLDTERYLASPPAWRKQVELTQIYTLSTLVGHWERAQKVPRQLRIGSGNNAWMSWAIQSIREHGTNDRRVRPAQSA